MSKPIDPIGVKPTVYDVVSTSQAGKDPGANFSDILTGTLKDRVVTQSLMPNMSGLSGMNAMPGAYTPSALAGMENALLATANTGEMSGAHLMLFMMMMMMQTSDNGGELAPIMQMVAEMLSKSTSSNNKEADLGNAFGTLQSEAENQQRNILQSLDTDPRVRRMVEIALSQVGTREKNADGTYGKGNFTEYGAWYGMDGQPWCAMFVSWSADQAGLLNSAVPKHASTSRGVAMYKEKGLYAPQKSGYVPREGDAIYFSTPSTGKMQHVGLVVAYDHANKKVYTVEGNTGNAVRIRHYDADNPRIDGYGRNGGTSFGVIPKNSTSGSGATTV